MSKILSHQTWWVRHSGSFIRALMLISYTKTNHIYNSTIELMAPRPLSNSLLVRYSERYPGMDFSWTPSHGLQKWFAISSQIGDQKTKSGAHFIFTLSKMRKFIAKMHSNLARLLLLGLWSLLQTVWMFTSTFAGRFLDKKAFKCM